MKNKVKATKVNLMENVKTIKVKLAVMLTMMHWARNFMGDFFLFCRRNRLPFHLHYMASSSEKSFTLYSIPQTV